MKTLERGGGDFETATQTGDDQDANIQDEGRDFESDGHEGGNHSSVLARPDAPKRGPDGWDRVEVLAFVKERKAAAAKAQTGDHAELKERKLGLECQILEERLTAERRANEVEGGKLIDIDEAVASVVRWGSEMATAVRVWRESEIAKHPAMAAEVGRMADRLMAGIRDGVHFGG